MTIAIGALAKDSTAIICAADKSVSFAEKITWDANATKILLVDNDRLIVMMSGDEGSVQRVVGKLCEKINSYEREKFRVACEDAYREAMAELIDRDVLHPRLLTRADFNRTISARQINEYMQTVASAVESYEFPCELLLCGFYDSGQPFVGQLRSPGVLTDMSRIGFYSIGAAWESAVNRMLWSDSKRTHDLSRVLYDVFDAKANAEMVPSVGYDWDAAIMTAGSRAKLLPPDTKDLLEKAWAKYNRSPFEKRDPKTDIASPPRGWKMLVETELIRLTTATPSCASPTSDHTQIADYRTAINENRS
jgi:20S proteasome alpha/beta subunit